MDDGIKSARFLARVDLRGSYPPVDAESYSVQETDNKSFHELGFLGIFVRPYDDPFFASSMNWMES
jgi:hypothetical protein